MKLEKLIQQQRNAKTQRERIDTTYSLAAAYFELRNFKLAVSEYSQLLKMQESCATTDRIEIALLYRSISECHLELGEFNQAMDACSQYLRISKEVGNKLEQQRALVTLGRCFQLRGDSVYYGEVASGSFRAAQQAIKGSIKIIPDIPGLSVSQTGEMKAVSLLNLGHTQRSCGNMDSAASSFQECIELARKHALPKIMFRAVFQKCELPLFSWPSVSRNLCSAPELLNTDEADGFANALRLCSGTLKFYGVQQCQDRETKVLRRNLEELLAQLYVGKAQYRMGAKVYRRLSQADAESSLNYRNYCVKCITMEIIASKIPNNTSNTINNLLQNSRDYEKLGDKLSSLDLHGPAFRCYQQMLLWAENAFSQHLKVDRFHDDREKLSCLAKQVDSALVSSAEACASLGAHALCAYYYRREILFNRSLSDYSLPSSASLNAEGMAQSWLSVARALIQAPKSTPVNFSPPEDAKLPGSNSPKEALKNALIKARASKSVDILHECLDEIVEYYKSCGREERAQPFVRELNALKSRSVDSENPASDACELCDKENTSLENSQNDALEAIDVLSSDSDVDQCISVADGAADLLESPGKRRTKALCLKTNLKGETPLHVAAINGNYEQVVKLVEILAHPLNVRDGAGWLPIHEAAFHDHADIATYLLDKGVDIDDTGCPEDFSTPLFEAIHGGALKTATILVNRGANLWHVNSEGETLSDIIKTWRPMKGDVGAQRIQLHHLKSAIKIKLGAAYEKWCSFRPPKPSIKPPPRSRNSVTIINDEDDSEEEIGDARANSPARSKISISSRRRRRVVSSEEDEEEEGGRGKSGWNKLKPSPRTRPLASLPPKPSSSKGSAVISDYRQAIKSVGISAAVRYPNEVAATLGKRPSTSRGRITVDSNDSWLEDDRSAAGRRCLKKRTRSDLPSPSNRPPRDKWPCFKKCADTCLCTPLDFNPNEALSSTLMDFRASSPKPVSPVLPRPASQPSPPTVVRPNPVPAPPTQQLLQHFSGPTQQTPSQGTVWCTVKVAFPDISLLVPIDSQHRTVKWLADEAYRRRQLLLEREASTFPESIHIRIRTSDKALLLPTDTLSAVLPAALNSSGAQQTTPELVAEVIEVTKQLPQSPTTAEFIEPIRPPLQQLSPQLRDAVSSAIRTGCLDLSFKALGVDGCTAVLQEYLRLKPASQNLKKLNLTGNLLQAVDIVPENGISSQAAIVRVFQLLLTPNFLDLNLSENSLTIESVIVLLSGHTTSPTPTNQLTRLCLSKNPLFSAFKTAAPTSLEAGLHSPHNEDDDNFDLLMSESLTLNPDSSLPQPLLAILLAMCPSLTSLQMACCGVTPELWEAMTSASNPNSFKTWQSSELVTVSSSSSQFFPSLIELDLSLNPLCSGASSQEVDFVCGLLTPPGNASQPAFNTVRALRLRGSLSEAPQVNSASDALLEGCSKNWLFPDNARPKPSGDVFVQGLVRLLDTGNCNIQTLDVARCSLTEKGAACLDKLAANLSSRLRFLLCEENATLQTPSVWASLMTKSGQNSSQLIFLYIDLPLLETEYDLSLAKDALSYKMGSSTPLQELVLFASASSAAGGGVQWPTQHRHLVPEGQKVSLSPTVVTALNQAEGTDTPLGAALLTHTALCFSKRFPQSASVRHRPARTVFSTR